MMGRRALPGLRQVQGESQQIVDLRKNGFRGRVADEGNLSRGQKKAQASKGSAKSWKSVKKMAKVRVQMFSLTSRTCLGVNVLRSVGN